MNLWHHADYLERKRLHHIWDRLIQRLTYMALANSLGECSGRPRLPDSPYPGPSASAASGQAASAAVAAPFTIDDLLEQVKGEAAETSTEPGFVSDVNLANVVYEIKTEVCVPAPAYDTDVEECATS